MELINKPMKQNQEEQKRNDLEIKQLKEVVREQTKQIDELKNDISILVGIFKKYDEVFSEKIELFSDQVKKINLAVNDVKQGVKIGAIEGTTEVIEGATKSALNKSLIDIDNKSKSIMTIMDKTGKKISNGILLSNIINNLSASIIVLLIILAVFLTWQFRSLRVEVSDKLYNMELIQDRLTDLTIGDGKYWYSKADKKAYFGKKKEIKRAKQQEKNKK